MQQKEKRVLIDAVWQDVQVADLYPDENVRLGMKYAVAIYYDRLRTVFDYYSSLSNMKRLGTMSSGMWTTFCRTCNMFDMHISPSLLVEIFKRVDIEETYKVGKNRRQGVLVHSGSALSYEQHA